MLLILVNFDEVMKLNPARPFIPVGRNELCLSNSKVTIIVSRPPTTHVYRTPVWPPYQMTLVDRYVFGFLSDGVACSTSQES